MTTSRSNWAKAKQYQPAEPDLRVNFLSVVLSTTEFDGSVLPFESEDQLAKLREEHGTSYVFRRRGPNVFCVPLEEVPNLGEKRTFSIHADYWLVQTLVREALVRFFRGQNKLLTRFDPVSFVHRERDLLAASLGKALSSKSQYLAVYPEYEFAPRTLHPMGGTPRQGVLINVRTTREINVTAAELVKLGLDVTGRYVLTAAQQKDQQRDPVCFRRLAGRVAIVNGTDLLLEDYRDVDRVSASEAWLEPRRENFADCLRLAGLPNVDSALTRLDELVFGEIGAPNRLKRIEDLANRLKAQSEFLCAKGLTFRFEDLLAPRYGIRVGDFRRHKTPEFVFDPAGSKVARWHDTGLNQFGPFDSEFFAPKHPEIVVVTPKAYRGEVEVFLRRFRDGIPHSKAFANGFLRKYHLNACNIRFEDFELSQYEALSYREACLRALQSTTKPNLAFVIIEERFHGLRGDDNPYLVAKSVFMSQGVPVQEVEIETIRPPRPLEGSSQYVLNNIGLACYAKLGGTPWVVASAPALAHELVIGIGSVVLKTGRLGGSERFVGITTIFSADGNYLLYHTSREVAFDNYEGELLDTLRRSIDEVKVRNGWRSGDNVRLIFHVFKPLKDTEARAVKRLVEKMTEFQVQFAFLHVSEEHDWLVFDKAQQGAEDWTSTDVRYRGKIKGTAVPERGYAIPLGRRTILLTTVGPRQLKTPLQGCPRPLLLNLHPESTFDSLDYLAGQLFKFSFMSWRSFFPSTTPVTILYSDRIAELLGLLREVKNWNPDVFATQLRNSRWFL